MSLLALLASTQQGGGGGDGGGHIDTTPYDLPTARPYNAPVYAPTPTADGSGVVVHPDVIDFAAFHGIPEWNGYRYWLGVTGFYQTNEFYENPHILASHDGFTWVVPPGGSNPIYPNPGLPNFYADTDLVYDPDGDRLILYWIEADGVGTDQKWLWASTSTDGVNWSAKQLVVHTALRWSMSPAVVRVAANDWFIFSYQGWMRGTDPLTGWTDNAQPYVWDNGAPNPGIWHLDVILWEGTFYMLIDRQSNTYLAATSTDGLSWTVDHDGVMDDSDKRWDQTLYRATLQPHEDGQRFRVWYTADGPSSWRLGYTAMQMSDWPTPA